MQRIGIPKPVAETGGVGEQVAQCDGPTCRPEMWHASGVKAGKDLGRGQRWVECDPRAKKRMSSRK